MLSAQGISLSCLPREGFRSFRHQRGFHSDSIELIMEPCATSSATEGIPKDASGLRQYRWRFDNIELK